MKNINQTVGEKYGNKLYTMGGSLNVRTVKTICRLAGVDDEELEIDSDGWGGHTILYNGVDIDFGEKNDGVEDANNLYNYFVRN